MSIHFISQLKECRNTDDFMKILMPTLQNGRVKVKRSLTLEEKKRLSQPREHVNQILLYAETEEGKPFEEKHKITLQFQRMYLANNYKYQVKLGNYISALESQDMRDTERADFKVTSKPFTGTPIESLKIPKEAIEKLNPEIKEVNGKEVALIKLTQQQINQIIPYSKAGTFLWRLSGYLRFHAGEKTEKDVKILETYFKGKTAGRKTYLPNVFNKFMRTNKDQLIEIIRSGNAKEKISEEVSKKYGIQIGRYKTESFDKLEKYLKKTPREEKEAMIKEIQEI